MIAGVLNSQTSAKHAHAGTQDKAVALLKNFSLVFNSDFFFSPSEALAQICVSAVGGSMQVCTRSPDSL